MKQQIKNIILALLLFMAGFGIQTSALEIVASEDVEITEIQTSDIAIAWGEIIIKADLSQDAIIAGWEVSIEAPIWADLTFAVWDMVISEKVSDDIRWMAGTVTIDSDVTWDVILATGNLRIKQWVTIGWDVIVATWKATIDGDILWKLRFAGGLLRLNGSVAGDAYIYTDEFKTNSSTGTTIWGNLTYRSEKKIPELESLSQGSITFDKAVGSEQFKNDAKEAFMSYVIIKVLFIFVFSCVLFFLFQKFYARVGTLLSQKTGKSFLLWLLTFILVPILAILFFISVIGIPVGFLLVFWFVMLVVFLEVINVTVITSLLTHHFPKINNTYAKVIIIFILSVIMALISGIDILIGFFTVGAMLITKQEIFQKFRDLE